MTLNYTALLLLAGLLLSAGCLSQTGPAPSNEPLTPADESAGIKTTGDGVRYLVHPSKIRGGGPPKDGIPSIDEPTYVSVDEADEWIADDELVLAIDYEGVTRAYPLQVMVWHEIVNDEIAGDPLLVTYCPLCGSGIAFERTIAGQAIEFGTSGKLYNSNLVMYDRKTDTYWSQIDGRAMVGSLAGRQLTPVSIDIVSWGDWKAANTGSEVLDRDTGYSRDYGRDPYGSYYEDDALLFPVEERDDRVHPKTVVHGIEVDGTYTAYKDEDVKELGVIEDTVADVPLRIEADEAGAVSVTRSDTGEEIVKQRVFWFAWYAFHPDTLLYQPTEQKGAPL